MNYYSSTKENLIYLELRRHRFHIYVGVMLNIEVDFLAQKSDLKIYI